MCVRPVRKFVRLSPPPQLQIRGKRRWELCRGWIVPLPPPQKNIFGINIFLGKGLHFPSHAHVHALLSTPYIQLPPPLTSYLKLRGGTKDELMDWTEHTMIVPFIVLDGLTMKGNVSLLSSVTFYFISLL